jgi:hypothetical protein
MSTHLTATLPKDSLIMHSFDRSKPIILLSEIISNLHSEISTCSIWIETYLNRVSTQKSSFDPNDIEEYRKFLKKMISLEMKTDCSMYKALRFISSQSFLMSAQRACPETG